MVDIGKQIKRITTKAIFGGYPFDSFHACLLPLKQYSTGIMAYLGFA